MAQGHSTFSIRLETEMLDEIKRIAERENRTMNAQIVTLIEKGIARYKKEAEHLRKLDQNDQEEITEPPLSKVRKISG